MRMETEIEHNNVKLQILLPEKRSLQHWITDQLTILAEAFNEAMTTEKLRIYVEDLASDLTREQLQIAFTRARRELKFFPKIAELRELACGAAKDQAKVTAEAAFQAAIRHLERKGVDAGIRSLPAPMQYAIRRCGGLATFNQRLEDSSYPFLQ